MGNTNSSPEDNNPRLQTILPPVENTSPAQSRVYEQHSSREASIHPEETRDGEQYDNLEDTFEGFDDDDDNMNDTYHDQQSIQSTELARKLMPGDGLLANDNSALSFISTDYDLAALSQSPRRMEALHNHLDQQAKTFGTRSGSHFIPMHLDAAESAAKYDDVFDEEGDDEDMINASEEVNEQMEDGPDDAAMSESPPEEDDEHMSDCDDSQSDSVLSREHLVEEQDEQMSNDGRADQDMIDDQDDSEPDEDPNPGDDPLRKADDHEMSTDESDVESQSEHSEPRVDVQAKMTKRPQEEIDDDEEEQVDSSSDPREDYGSSSSGKHDEQSVDTDIEADEHHRRHQHANGCNGLRGHSTPPPELSSSQASLTTVQSVAAARRARFARFPDPTKDLSRTVKDYRKLHDRALESRPRESLPERRYWVVVVPEGKPYRTSNAAKSFVWMMCNRLTTVETIRREYSLRTASEDTRFLLGHLIVQDPERMEELDVFSTKLIVLRSMHPEEWKSLSKKITDGIVMPETKVSIITNTEVVIVDDD